MQELYKLHWYHQQNREMNVHSLYIATMMHRAIRTVWETRAQIYRIRSYTILDLLRIEQLGSISTINKGRRYFIYNMQGEIIFSTVCSRFGAIAEFFTRTTILVPLSQRAFVLEEVWHLTEDEIDQAFLATCDDMVETGRLYQAIAQIREYA